MMKVLLLAFANSRENPLPTLAEEYSGLNKILSPRVLRQHFLSWSVSHASLDDIAYYLTLFGDKLSLFLFSGHAGRDQLITENQEARAGGIAYMLGQCKNLKVVILNGCSTGAQVAALHAAGIPLVIATSAPIGDDIAAGFSIRLFHALETGLTIGEAFEIALGEVLSKKDIAVTRGLALRPDNTPEQPLWGIFPNPAQPEATTWKLPAEAAQLTPNLQYEPNEYLLEKLYETLAETNPQVAELRDKGATLENQKRKIKNALEDSLPAPISEHLRKLLLTSLPGEEEGYDQINARRLEQLARTYQITIDFLIFLILAQQWEIIIKSNAAQAFKPEIQRNISNFLALDITERKQCDYYSVLYQLSEAFVEGNEALFVPELSDLHKELANNSDFKDACFFLETLRRQSDMALPTEMATLCARAEECLALIFSKLGFLGSYFVATVRNIGVVKPRHVRQAAFEHMVVIWHGTQGDCESDTILHPEFLDNRSVVLLRRSQEDYAGNILGDSTNAGQRFLNLSPFIIDENTFDAIPTNTVSKLFLYAGGDHQGRIFYKYINKPDSETIDLDDPVFYEKTKKASKFQLAKVQFEAFKQLVLTNPQTA